MNFNKPTKPEMTRRERLRLRKYKANKPIPKGKKSRRNIKNGSYK